MNVDFPASGFPALARLIEAEGEVFQLHVLDLLRDHRNDSGFHAIAMETLHQRLAPQEIEGLLRSLPDAVGYAATAPYVQEILKLAAGLGGTHMSRLDAAEIIASELIHRKKWEKVMAENPGTLQALKDKMR